ncbi:exonuclease SbcC [Anoxybacillus vitaminiphilus]|uniref:Nuclease SbcCD subunit C n=1 Tax=Paranoxybacillus vitaminiphilus TaxID=581036 RepID=A0A327YMP5_9BACL|nr:SMC family ATPase [Anoxybacillus vitaminiphilus]RAK19519.1 exonuclease SbcC [Anoxybacillus vitaminiphilus]
MKPISLTVAGLHSFREKQVIDFQKLCEGGVFGIFGPTGSGKSSILDAMTLALFGSVERASNNTHGIINHAENQLFVSFTFELENAQGKKRYTVERSFKRSDEWRIKSTSSRLIEIDKESIVLADKTNEVNKQIEQLLGLEMKDFTRAVVLPQGKFAEFLSLKGVERRQMLQRLFHLEQYGDKLNKKLKQRLGEASSQLNEIMAEQSGLGDASKEAIERAEKELRDCETLLQKRQAELKQTEEEYEKKKQLWIWQKEKEDIEAKLGKLQQEEGAIRLLEVKKEQGEQAERLRPYLEQYEAARNAVAAWQIKLANLQRRAAEAKERYNQSLQHYELVRREKAEKEPQLLTKKEQLEQVKQMFAEMKKLEAQVASFQQQLKLIEQREKEKNEKFNEVEQLYQRGSEKQKMLKSELQQYHLSVEEKEKVYRAYEEKQQLMSIQQTVQESKMGLLRKQEALQQAYEVKARQETQALSIKEKIKSIFSRIEKNYHHVCERELQLTKLIYKKEKELEEARAKQEKEKTRRLASLLAQQLRQGEACPVCGSLEHPHPYKHMEEETTDSEEIIKQLERFIKQGQSGLQLLYTLKIQLEQLAQTVMEHTFNELQLQPTDINKIITEESETIQQLEVEIKSLQQDYLQIKEEVQQALQRLRRFENERLELEKQINMLQADIEERKKQYEQRQEHYQSLKEKWHEQYKDFDFDTMEQLREQIRQKENALQQLQQRIERSVQFLEEKRKEWEQLREEKQMLEKEKIHFVSLLETKQELLREYEAKIKGQLGDEQVERLLAHVEREMMLLKEQEEKAYDAWQNSQQIYQTLESEMKAAWQALEEGRRQYEEAESKWKLNLGQTSFQSEEEVRQAFLSRQEKEHLKEKVEQYWSGVKKWKIELERVSKAMAGHTVTEEEWEQIQALRQEMRESVNEAIQQVGAAQKIVEELLKKHERFNELERKREKLSLLVSRYTQLQNVLKGNSFVEFIAEEQLIQVTQMASERLGSLTRQRYAIEVDSQGGFIIRDDANGGVRRPVTTLSGGETFLTSLSLALALSAQIQLRGEYPLQFFFLDEGFGTLDAELLDTVISALEKLHSNQLAIGVISHVQELRARLPKRLIVEPAEPSGRGTRVKLEMM